jgi:hypothetical protein
MRNRISLFLLAAFFIFLGIAALHPFSHDLHHREDGGHECPICLWIYFAALASLSIVVLLIIAFLATGLIFITPGAMPGSVFVPTNIPRAPPKAIYFCI